VVKDVRGTDLAGLRLLGERLCLNFANTVDPRHGDHPQEFLNSYADLIAWSARAGLLDEPTRSALTQIADQDRAAAEAVFARALRLRQALYRVFSGIAAGAEAPATELDALNQAVGEAFAHTRLQREGDGYHWGWRTDPPALDRMLWPVVRSAVDLLTSGQLARVKECPGPDGCGWLFYDTSKNGSRRWCSMEGCGNRAKGRRHYQRTRAVPA
jgi:predicted RNA-binding Zn ribbon-like protein